MDNDYKNHHIQNRHGRLHKLGEKIIFFSGCLTESKPNYEVFDSALNTASISTNTITSNYNIPDETLLILPVCASNPLISEPQIEQPEISVNTILL